MASDWPRIAGESRENNAALPSATSTSAAFPLIRFSPNNQPESSGFCRRDARCPYICRRHLACETSLQSGDCPDHRGVLQTPAIFNPAIDSLAFLAQSDYGIQLDTQNRPGTKIFFRDFGDYVAHGSLNCRWQSLKRDSNRRACRLVHKLAQALRLLLTSPHCSPAAFYPRRSLKEESADWSGMMTVSNGLADPRRSVVSSKVL